MTFHKSFAAMIYPLIFFMFVATPPVIAQSKDNELADVDTSMVQGKSEHKSDEREKTLKDNWGLSVVLGIPIIGVKEKLQTLPTLGTLGYGVHLGIAIRFGRIFILEPAFSVFSISAKSEESTRLGPRDSSTKLRVPSLAAGVRTPIIRILETKKSFNHMTLGMNIGVEGVSGKRFIPNCTDCREGKFDLKGGSFMEFKLTFLNQHTTFGGLEIAFRRSNSDESDLNWRFQLSWVVQASGGW